MTLLKTHNPARPLPPEIAAELMARFIDQDTDPLLVGACLALLAQRTPEAHELLAFARTLQAASVPFPEPGIAAVDTCGTGGDGAATANLSTLAALYLASRGIPVLKHGNRAATSACGSADLLEALGCPLTGTPSARLDDLKRTRFAFLFAPAYHPLLGRLREIRTRLGIPTIFNLLGPLLNPGRPAFQVLGVAREDLLAPMAGALAGLGVRRAFVIHGRDGAGRGLDEASIEGPTQVVAVVEGDVHPMAVIHAAGLGIPVPRPGALGITGLADSLRLTSALLEGRAEPALADAVALQAALGTLLHRGLGLEALGATFKELRSALDAGFALPFEAAVR